MRKRLTLKIFCIDKNYHTKNTSTTSTRRKSNSKSRQRRRRYYIKVEVLSLAASEYIHRETKPLLKLARVEVVEMVEIFSVYLVRMLLKFWAMAMLKK
jgi:hypothetical protein